MSVFCILYAQFSRITTFHSPKDQHDNDNQEEDEAESNNNNNNNIKKER